MKRYLVILEGRVQGVGCRYFVSQLAHKYHLSGSVGNLTNGNVEIEVQGNESNLQQFMNELLKGNIRIRIDNYSYRSCNVHLDETSFIYKN